MTPKRVRATVECRLTADELYQAGQQLAAATREAIACETDKKAAQAAYKARAEEAARICAELSLKITRRYEMRELDCIVNFGEPEAGKKQIVRPDTGEVVRTEDMTADELQSGFEFGEGEKPQ